MLKLRDSVLQDTIFSIRIPNKDGDTTVWTRGEVHKPVYVRLNKSQAIELRDFLVTHLARVEKDGI